MFTLPELESVIPLVRASVSPTPQYAWPLLKERTGVEVVVKQPAGARDRHRTAWQSRPIAGFCRSTRWCCRVYRSAARQFDREERSNAFMVATSMKPKTKPSASRTSAALNLLLRFTVISSSALRPMRTSCSWRLAISTPSMYRLDWARGSVA